MYLILIVAAVLLLDQITKYVVSINFEQGQTLPVIKNIFHLTYVQNPGAAFGMLAYWTTFFIFVTLVVILIILFVYRKVPASRYLLRIGLSLQLAGALGNLIDRLRFGYVVDFLDFRIWPVFNFADVAIVVGVGLLALDIIRTPEERKEV